jgi:hypothetical protein
MPLRGNMATSRSVEKWLLPARGAVVLLATSANCSGQLLNAAHRLTVRIVDVSHRARSHRYEKHMLKKLFVTAAAAAAVSVPFA